MANPEQERVTIDHETIREWAQERGGYPAAVRGSGQGPAGEAGVLQIGFEDEPNEDLEPISWEEFFEKFEEKALQMRYRAEPGDGDIDRFHAFDNRNRRP